MVRLKMALYGKEKKKGGGRPKRDPSLKKKFS